MPTQAGIAHGAWRGARVARSRTWRPDREGARRVRRSRSHASCIGPASRAGSGMTLTIASGSRTETTASPWAGGRPAGLGQHLTCRASARESPRAVRSPIPLCPSPREGLPLKFSAHASHSANRHGATAPCRSRKPHQAAHRTTRVAPCGPRAEPGSGGHDDELPHLAELLRLDDVQLHLAVDRPELVARERLR